MVWDVDLQAARLFTLVLILLLVEYGLGSSRMDEAVHGNRVLILLLVEYGLGSNGETF